MQTQAYDAFADKGTGKNYREFSRKRYTELKNAHGSQMRESEIIKRIISEWDEIQISKKSKRSMGSTGKTMTTPMKVEENQMAMDLKNMKQLKSTSAKKEDEMNEERSSFEQELNEVSIQPFTTDPMPKVKMIKKAKKVVRNVKYIDFYKMHFQRLMKAHPMWTSNQITVIVKLLWQYEKMKRTATPAGRSIVQKKSMKILSGRMAFKKSMSEKGMPREEIMMKWKHLPIESKIMWALEGNPMMEKSGMKGESSMSVGKKFMNLNMMMRKKMMQK